MTTSVPTPANEGSVRLAVAAAVLLAAGLFIGIVLLRSDNSAILAAINRPAVAGATVMAVDYTDMDGNERHVSVTADGSEPAQTTAIRLREKYDAMLIQFPKRK